MKTLTVLILALALGSAACAPRPTGLRTPTPIPTSTPPHHSPAPLSESLLLLRNIPDTGVTVLTAIDPANGDELACATPLSIGLNYVYAVSPDRKSLAVVGYRSNTYPHSPHLYLIDLQNWSSREMDLPLDEWIVQMGYAPDSRYLAIATGQADSRVLVVDTDEAAVIIQGKLDFSIRQMKFDAHGTNLMLYGLTLDPSDETTTGDPLVALVRATDLETLWTATLPQLRDGIYSKNGQPDADLHTPGQAYAFTPGLAFAPDHDLLYVANSEKDELLYVDFAARSVQTHPIHVEESWLDQLLAPDVALAKGADGNQKNAVVSPDGKFLYINGTHNEFSNDKDGNPQFLQIPLGLQVIRAADAVQVSRINSAVNDLALSADGKYAYLHVWNTTGPVTDVLDIQQGRVIASLPGLLFLPTRRLNGDPLLVSAYNSNGVNTTLAVFKPGTTQPFSSWSVPDYAEWIVIPQ